MYPNLKYIDPKMTSLSLSTLSLTDLLNRRSLIDAEIAKQTGGASVVATESSKGKKEKKPSSRTGKPTSWSAFSSMLQKAHAEEIKAYKTANPELKSAHLKWVGDYKDTHAEEYETFKINFEAENPKTTVTEVTTVSEAQEGAEKSTQDKPTQDKSTEDKPKRVLSAEHKAKMQAGRKLASAKKQEEKNKEEAEAVADAPVSLTVAVATPVATTEPVTEPVTVQAPKKKVIRTGKKAPVVQPVEEVQPAKPEGLELPYKIGSSSYLRIGVPNENGEPNWLSNDLWQNKRGVRGTYVGELMDDGSINTDAEEPPLTSKKAWE
jgi:hypothetical protein